MTNRTKGILGIGVFVLSSLEQTLSAFYGRFFEQPIDPIVLVGIVGLVYGLQKFKTPDIDVGDISKFVKFVIGCLILGLISVLCTKSASYIVSMEPPTLSWVGLVVTLKTLASFSWCLATIAALLSLRDVFTMK